MKTFEAKGAPPEFDQLTGIDSRALVGAVVNELRQHFGTEPPTELETVLRRRLLAFFVLHGCWRARILRAPAPDFVKIFLRRWASELLFHHRRALYDGLPRSYRTGGSLPALRPLPLGSEIKTTSVLEQPTEVFGLTE